MEADGVWGNSSSGGGVLVFAPVAGEEATDAAKQTVGTGGKDRAGGYDAPYQSVGADGCGTRRYSCA